MSENETKDCPYVTGDVTRYCTLTPLTLTDAEREALCKILDHYSRVYDEHGASEDDDHTLTALRGLLERTK